MPLNQPPAAVQMPPNRQLLETAEHPKGSTAEDPKGSTAPVD
jgi:hypothetical protein